MMSEFVDICGGFTSTCLGLETVPAVEEGGLHVALKHVMIGKLVRLR